MARQKKKGPGRGWHGDSAGHAKAGRKGGMARKKSSGRNRNNNDGGGFFGMGE